MTRPRLLQRKAQLYHDPNCSRCPGTMRIRDFFLLMCVFGLCQLLHSVYRHGPPLADTSAEAALSEDPPPDLLLSVPFYVYEELAWVNATYGTWPVSKHALRSRNEQYDTRFNHGDDYFFMNASLNHPMRTRNIDEAKLFFVPWLYNYFVTTVVWGGQRTHNLCWNGRCDNELLDYSQKILQDSEAFQKYPERHVMVRSHFSSAGYWSIDFHNFTSTHIPGLNEVVEKMSAVIFEDVEPERKSKNQQFLPSYYVGSNCGDNSFKEEKRYDVAMIGQLRTPEVERFKDRRNICKWLNNSSTIKTSVCGAGSRCPALSQSKFGFHVSGDSWGSQRAMDTILSGSVPIFTDSQQYRILGNWIDWTQLTYFFPIHDESSAEARTYLSYFPKYNVTGETFLERLHDIIDDKGGYERKHKAVLENAPLFDYTTMYPFDTYMYLFQARLFPETRQAKSRWSSLKLPPLINGGSRKPVNQRLQSSNT